MTHSFDTALRVLGTTLAVLLLGFMAVPIAALVFASSPSELWAATQDPLFLPALALSAKTTLLTLLVVVVAGTPLSWWLATRSTRQTRIVEALVVLPIILPPAVVGVALLEAFGRQGLLGPMLDGLGVRVPFTTTAVVAAQVLVSAPFYVESAAIAFRRVDVDLVLVARTLGASPAVAFLRVAVPVAATGLLAGAALAYARSIGEFGATLLFAGNLPGTTQTMPLAIYTALESDVRVAVAISLALAAIALLLLVAIRVAPATLSARALLSRNDGSRQ